MSVSISTHVLDTGAGGRPQVCGSSSSAIVTSWSLGETDDDGRIAELATGLEPGRYALVFWPPSPFFTRVELEVDLVAGHYHVPLLVSPYGCASYRGS